MAREKKKNQQLVPIRKKEEKLLTEKRIRRYSNQISYMDLICILIGTYQFHMIGTLNMGQ